MKFDDVLFEIGEFGRYQKRMYFLVCLMIITVACHQLAQVFLAARVDHWCLVPEIESDNCSQWETFDGEPLSPQECRKEKMKLSIPPDPVSFMRVLSTAKIHKS